MNNKRQGFSLNLSWYQEHKLGQNYFFSQPFPRMAKEDEYSSSQPNMDLEYHLGSSDHPRIVITPVKLKGPNYDEWAKAVRRALIAKWKFGFVDGMITKPSMGSSKHKHWVAVNSMLVSWITNTLDDGLRSTIED
jgi:LTR polyprotein gag-polypeptide-like protein